MNAATGGSEENPPDPRLEIHPRIRTALRGMGHSIFPFNAFDEFGELTLTPLKIPAQYTELAKQVAQSPVFEAVYTHISVLEEEPDWRCYSLGLSFTPDYGISIIPVKSLDSLNVSREEAPRVAGEWATSLNELILENVQQVAGADYVLPDQIAKAVKELLPIVRKLLPDKPGGGQGPGPGTEPGPGPGPEPEPGPEPGPEPIVPLDLLEAPGQHHAGVPALEAADAALAAASPWSPVLGLELAAAVLSAAAMLRKKQSVTATIVWYPPDSWEGFDEAEWDHYRKHLKPISYRGRRKVVHACWNPFSRKVLAFGPDDLWNSDNPHVPKRPSQVQRAFYPIG
ncbi:MAG TPA: hypothetical protein VF517_02125 [Thermoleophilaceae bacterium]